MSDMIYRADAIDAVAKHMSEKITESSEVVYNSAIRCAIFELQSLQSALPSAELVLQTPQTYGKSINPSNAEVVADYISRADAIEAVRSVMADFIPKLYGIYEAIPLETEMALRHIPSAESVPQSEQYKKGFEDAKRAFLIEYSREIENMRKRNAQLEAMLNVQKAISAEAVQGEWTDIDNYYRLATCSHCHKVTMFEKWGEYTQPYHYCPNCGAKMTKGGEE